MRVGSNAPSYLLGDHLGSTSITASSTGSKVAGLRYHPWGGTRFTSGTTPTTRRYTGQVEDATIGLYFYNARYYDPYLNRFISPDSIVPAPQNPQSLNRYSYVLNSPLRYTDPTGHIEQGEVDDAQKFLDELAKYGVGVAVDWGWVFLGMGGTDTVWLSGLWTLDQLDTVLKSVQDFASAAGGTEAARKAIGGAIFVRTSDGQTMHWGFGLITLADHTFNQSKLRAFYGPRISIVHELAHYWDWRNNKVWQIHKLDGPLARGLPQREDGPTAYGRTLLREEWAESVAGYVYPQYYWIIRAEGKPTEVTKGRSQFGPCSLEFDLPGLGPQHYAYVERQFRSLTVTP